jgi:hypothetical protein
MDYDLAVKMIGSDENALSIHFAYVTTIVWDHTMSQILLTTQEPDLRRGADTGMSETVTKQIVFAIENSIDLEDELASRLQSILSGPSPPAVSYIGIVSDQAIEPFSRTKSMFADNLPAPSADDMRRECELRECGKVAYVREQLGIEHIWNGCLSFAVKVDGTPHVLVIDSRRIQLIGSKKAMSRRKSKPGVLSPDLPTRQAAQQCEAACEAAYPPPSHVHLLPHARMYHM